MGKKQELGKGIRALLKTMDDETSVADQSSHQESPGVAQVLIRAHPRQSRPTKESLRSRTARGVSAIHTISRRHPAPDLKKDKS